MPGEKVNLFLRTIFYSKSAEKFFLKVGYIPVHGKQGAALSWADKLNRRLADKNITPSADAHGRFLTDVTCEEIKLKGSHRTSTATIVAWLACVRSQVLLLVQLFLQCY